MKQGTSSKGFSARIIELNLAVLFISTSGVLGRYIDLPIPITIGSRALLAGIILFLFCKWKGIDLRIKKKDKGTMLLSGVLLGIHWITYFYALKLSNVAIAMLSLFTFPAITAILEPLMLKTKVQKAHLALGLTILIGIYFLVPDLNLENSHSKAVGFGVLSALTFSIRNILIKAKADQYNGSALMVNQLFTISVLLCPFFFLLDSSNVIQYLPATFLLALLTTAIGHTLFLYSFKHFSTVSASIISSLQPVYGILLAILFLGEYPSLSTVLGGSIIISSVVLESVRVYRMTITK